MIDEILHDRIEDISENVFDDDSSKVATTISGYIAKKLFKWSKCKDCEKKLVVHEQDLENDQYLTLFSRGGLYLYRQMSSQNSFAAVLRFWILLQMILYQLAKSLDLQCMFEILWPQVWILCSQHHLNWGVKFAAKIVANVSFNNKQKQAKDCFCWEF